NALRLEQQVVEGLFEERPDLGEGPVVAGDASGSGAHGVFLVIGLGTGAKWLAKPKTLSTRKGIMVYNWLTIDQFCQLCDDRCEAGQTLCAGCEADLPWLGGQCRICALPLPTLGMTCGECLKRPPSFDHVAVPWRFAFPLDTLINRF